MATLCLLFKPFVKFYSKDMLIKYRLYVISVGLMWNCDKHQSKKALCSGWDTKLSQLTYSKKLSIKHKDPGYGTFWQNLAIRYETTWLKVPKDAIISKLKLWVQGTLISLWQSFRKAKNINKSKYLQTDDWRQSLKSLIEVYIMCRSLSELTNFSHWIKHSCWADS